MKMSSLKLFSLAAVMAVALTSAASAETLVKATLWDKGATMEMSTNFAYGTPGLDKSKATMGIKLSRSSVPAGKIKFDVKNDSKDTIHEMVVLMPTDLSKIPYIDNENRIDEEKSGHKGEVSELDPGKSGSLIIDLKPGQYMLVCNIPGHYKAGMWELFTVTK